MGKNYKSYFYEKDKKCQEPKKCGGDLGKF
jgi:hypothetical protein